MYSLLTEFRDGDNVVTTLMEHNSNYVPWYGMCREILPRLGRRVECRLARFDPVTGELDLAHLASLIDARTKLVCCTGASNFLGTRPDLAAVRALAGASGYAQPNGERRSYLLVDGAQLVPGSFVDVRALDVDFLAFSFHKLLAPFGVGVLYAKQHLLEAMLPFLYGGDMIAEGQVFPDRVGYNAPAVEVRGRHAQHLGRDRLRAGGAAAAGPGAVTEAAGLVRHRQADRARRPSGRRWAA